MILVVDYQYFPSVNLFSSLINEKHVNFEIYETYQKGGFRNRCEVIGSNGIVQLVVPLAGGRTQKRLITEVKIDSREDWRRAHFRTLLSCYNRSAFFEHYRDGLEVLFQKDTSWLVEWNLACFEWVIDQLKLDVIVGKTSSFQSKYEDTQHHDFRGLLRPGHYAVPGISTVEYAQVFMERSAFVPGLSILDMLFCEGPRASRILKQMAGM